MRFVTLLPCCAKGRSAPQNPGRYALFYLCQHGNHFLSFTTSWPGSPSPTMAPALYIARALNHSSLLLHAQYSVAVKRSDLSSCWLCFTSALTPGWTCRPPPVQQRRFASNKDQGSSNRKKESSNKDKESSNKDKESSKKDEEWYDWYARLHADPKDSVKDLRKAFYKRAKVEHPDHDRTPGAKERFHNASNKPTCPAPLPFH